MRPKRAYTVPLALLLLIVCAPGQALARASAAARLTACSTSLSQPDRYLVAEGSMRATAGSSRLQMRFELQSRTPQRPSWHTLIAPGFGVWNSADPAVRRYVYQKRVQALAAPADYRLVVQFRWLDAGRPVAQLRRVTRVCRQPDLRPDLVPRRLQVGKAGSGAGRYVVRLANSGASASGAFSVVVVVNGVALPGMTVANLQPGAATRVEIAGPGCAPGSAVTVRVDADGHVDERDETGNELARPCRE